MSINLNVAPLTFVFKVLNLRQTKTLMCCLWFILILTVGLYAAVSTSHAADEAVIWVNPSQSTVGVGELFNVTIQIDNLPNLPSPNGAVGFEIGLVWDPAILTGINMTEVLFHSVTPEANWDNIWRIVHTINNTAGNLKYAYTFQNTFDADEAGYSPITGNHTLAVVTFNGTRSGTSHLTFMLVKIGDEVHPTPMAYTAINGTVSVGNPAPEIIVSSPVENTTYNSNSLSLAFTLSKSQSWIGYSIDGHSNVTISGNTNIQTSDGQHSIIVYANDTIGQMGASDPVHFTTDTLPPTVSFTFSPQPPEPTYNRGNFKWAINFYANASSDAASGIAIYNWNFGDGNNETGETASHIYIDSGSYIVNLTITDNAGHSAAQTQTITINPASLPLSIPLELILAIVIPAAWIPALAYYFIRGSRRRKLRKTR
jgi:PKD repeat protein